jgi:hypothetical protein
MHVDVKPTGAAAAFHLLATALLLLPSARAVGQAKDPCAGSTAALHCIFQSENTGQTPELFAGMPPLVAPGLTALSIPSGSALGGETDVYAAIVSDLPGDGVQGWSLSLDVRGEVTLLDAGTAGTVAAGVSDVPPGLRDQGFERTVLLFPGELGLEQGVVSHVVLSLEMPVTLAPTGTATVLALRLSGGPGAAGELLWFGHVGSGEGGGASLMPGPNSATVQGKTTALCEVSSTVRFEGAQFRRGDCNDDGRTDISDAICMLCFFLSFSCGFPCLEALDANDDADRDISDPIFLLSSLFLGGRDPPPPFPGCGTDPTPDFLGCIEFTSCPE